MADQDKNQEQELQKLSLKERTALNDAYSAIAGQQAVNSFAAFTLEEALDAYIQKVEDKNGLRPCLLDRVDSVEKGLTSIVDQLKAMPPESFQDPKPEEDVSGNGTGTA